MSGRAQGSPLGATMEADGARFRAYSEGAEQLFLCLFESDDHDERRLPMVRGDDDVWEIFVAGLGAGVRYALRADGPYAPSRGQRFDVTKLLLDPYARQVSGPTAWHADLDPRRYGSDTSAVTPRAVTVASEFDWRGDRFPGTPWEDTVVYEAHVKGLTRLHPSIPVEERGSYLGLGHPAVVEHLLALGVTAVQLLPVQQHFTERHLVESGLTNYWGYNPLAWFAPQASYAAGPDPVSELKEAVRALHAAGLEVLLDVVFNHSAEGDAGGPTLSLRGLDNRSYYRLEPGDASRYVDFTGCGNTLDFGRPVVRRLAHDCLRYWVDEMHVDGFRFDLAVTLGRGESGLFESAGPFFRELAADPVLSRVKLIAEPWDLGPQGHQLGHFPPGWREWNDRFRDQARQCGIRSTSGCARVASRLAGSPDLFPPQRRGTSVSVNYVTSHDGFTLADVVAYDRRHNEANGEGNRDGHAHEISFNHGVEGPSEDPAILERRRRAIRRMAALLALAHGVPMLAHGDEFGRSQLGNNNAYCQDNELTWIDWSGGACGRELCRLWTWLFRVRRRLLRQAS